MNDEPMDFATDADFGNELQWKAIEKHPNGRNIGPATVLRKHIYAVIS